MRLQTTYSHSEFFPFMYRYYTAPYQLASFTAIITLPTMRIKRGHISVRIVQLLSVIRSIMLAQHQVNRAGMLMLSKI